MALFLFIAALVIAYLLFLVGALRTRDEIFDTIGQDLAAIPASVKAGCRAVAGIAAALAWLYGPSAFAPKFWRAWRFPWPKRRRKGAHARAEAAS